VCQFSAGLVAPSEMLADQGKCGAGTTPAHDANFTGDARKRRAALQHPGRAKLPVGRAPDPAVEPARYFGAAQSPTRLPEYVCDISNDWPSALPLIIILPSYALLPKVVSPATVIASLPVHAIL